MLQRKSVELPISSVCTNPEQPRKFFSEEELFDLRDSIAEYGVLQPILVKKYKDGTYSLIAGERRLRAAKLAGLSRIPALIKDFDEKDAAFISVVENVQREDLSYIEEAYAYKKLIDDFGLTQGELAARIGKRQSTISNKLRILTLPPDIQQQLVDAHLTERHARALLRVDKPEIRKKVLQRVINHNLNVKQTEKLIDEYLAKEEASMRKKKKIGYISYKIYMNTIKKAFAQIHDMEENAEFYEDDKGEYVELKIVIPKNQRCFT